MYRRLLRVNWACIPCILSFQLNLSEYSEVGRVLAELLPERPLSVIPKPH